MKLTKTQINLLREAAKSHHGIVSHVRMFQTSGAKKSVGYRATDAALSLIDAGFLVFVGSHRSQEHRPGRIMVRHYVESSYAITDAGRAAIANA